jgi:hypothetical protein
MVQETVSMEGHLIDSDILRKTFDRIVEGGGEFEVLDFHVGRTNDEASKARLTVSAPDPATLDRILESLTYLGRRRSSATRGSSRPKRTAYCPTSSTRPPTSRRSSASTAAGRTRSTRRWTRRS